MKWWKFEGSGEYDYFSKTGLKKMCISCRFFHKGVKVHHSHCEYKYKRRDVLRHSGRIPACEYYEKKGE